MRLRTFRASTLQEAMRQLRAELGEDAVIVASGEFADGAQVTAAGQGPDEEDDLSALLAPAEAASVRAEIAAALAVHGVPAAVRDTIEAELSDRRAATIAGDAASALAAALAQRLRFDPLGPPGGGRTVALVGPSGGGKTAAAARLAATWRLAGHPVRVLCADTGRAGALEQLTALLGPIGLSPEPVRRPAELQAHLPGSPDGLTVIDTTGVNPFRGAEMAALVQWLTPSAGAGGAEAVLVLPAGGDAQDAVETVGAFATIGVRRCLVTRLDATRRLGSVVAAGATGVALAEASVSPLIGKPMPPLTPAGLARLLLRRGPSR